MLFLSPILCRIVQEQSFNARINASYSLRLYFGSSIFVNSHSKRYSSKRLIPNFVCENFYCCE